MPVKKTTPKAPESVELSFTKERETKNTVRFSEDSENPVVGTLYIQKSAANDLGNPDNLTVTITAA